MLAAAQGIARFGLAWVAIVAVSFLLIRLTPADPVQLFLARADVRVDDAVLAAYRAEWGLDRPAALQFFKWLGGFVTLDWGRSFETGAPVLEDFARRAPWSLAIGVGGLATAVALGFALGYAAARRPGGAFDAASRAMALAAQALPAVAVAIVILWLFAAEFKLIRPYSGGLAERLLLPIALVAFFSVGAVARVARAAFGEVRAALYFQTALAKGLSSSAALWRHGRRHAALTVLAAIAPELVWVVGGTAVAEIVFGAPGLSERLVQAVSARDYPVLQAYVALVALWVLAMLQLASWVRSRLDPRIAR